MNQKRDLQRSTHSQCMTGLGRQLDHDRPSRGHRVVKEKELQALLASSTRRVFSALGVDLMCFGKEMVLGPRCRPDLLAIDATGAMYVIELKVRPTKPEVVPQLSDYREALLAKTKADLVQLYWRYNATELAADFKRYFGKPLPARINRSRRVILIAESYDPRTVASIQDLRRTRYPIEAYSYLVQHKDVRLTHARPVGADEDSTRQDTPTVREDVQNYWDEHFSLIKADVFTFRAMHDGYATWFFENSMRWGHLGVAQWGQFGRALDTLARASGVWRRVYLPAGYELDPFEASTNEVPSWSHRAAGFMVLAYRRSARAIESPDGRSSDEQV